MDRIAARLGFATEDAVPTEGNKNYVKKALFHIGQLLRLAPARRALDSLPEHDSSSEPG